MELGGNDDEKVATLAKEVAEIKVTLASLSSRIKKLELERDNNNNHDHVSRNGIDRQQNQPVKSEVHLSCLPFIAPLNTLNTITTTPTTNKQKQEKY